MTPRPTPSVPPAVVRPGSSWAHLLRRVGSLPYSRHPTLSIEEAADWIGISRTLAYELARADELPCPVIRAGRRLAVPARPLMRVLGVEPDQLTAPIHLTVDIDDVADMFGFSLGHSYELARVDALPSPVLRVGHRLLVPTWPLMRVLGIADDLIEALGLPPVLVEAK